MDLSEYEADTRKLELASGMLLAYAKALEDVVFEYADGDNWLMGARFDPNGPNFEDPASEVLERFCVK
jgi:hypothetical protein